jgi:hypothetical protein
MKSEILAGRPMSLKSVAETIDGIISAAMLVFLICCMAAFDFPHMIEVVAIGCVVVTGIGVVHWKKYTHQSRNV